MDAAALLDREGRSLGPRFVDGPTRTARRFAELHAAEVDFRSGQRVRCARDFLQLLDLVGLAVVEQLAGDQEVGLVLVELAAVAGQVVGVWRALDIQ